MEFACLNVYLKNGMIFGCAAIHSTVKLDTISGQYRPAIAFVCSRHTEINFVEEIEKITISTETWCPTCK